MSAPEPALASFGDLRALLQRGERSLEAWDAICGLLERMPRDQRRHEAVPYARDHLRHWSPFYRRAPIAWVKRLLRGEEVPELGIATALELGGGAHRLTLQDLERLCAPQPALAAVRELSLHNQWLPAVQLGPLLQASWLDELEKLDLSGNLIGDEGVRSLAARAPWPTLKTLSLRSNGMGRAGVTRLLDSALMLHLEELDLSRNDLGWGIGGQLVTRAQTMRKLHTLRLDRCELAMADAAYLGELLLRASALRELSIKSNHLGDMALEQLLQSAAGAPLEALSLRQNLLGPHAARALRGLERLVTLELGEDVLEGGVFTELARHPRLEDLALTGPITDAYLELTRDGDALHRLRYLALQDGAVSSREAWRGMLETRWMRQLTSLRLIGLRLTPELIDDLAQTPFEQLIVFNLTFGQLDDEGAEALSRAPWLANLRALSLSSARITERGRATLASSQHLPASLRASALGA